MKTKRKNIFKSLLALTLALIMVLGVAPISELAGVDWASFFAPKAEAEGKSIVYVETLTPTNSARYTGNQGDSCMGKIGIRNGTVGVTGTAYTHGLEAWVARWNGTEEKSWVWNEYAIDGKYNRLTGIIDFCHYSFDGWDYTKYPHTTQFEVLGDGKVLYSKVLDSNISTYPIDLNVDVTGVSVLKIYFYDLEASKVGSSFLLGNLALSESGGSVSESNLKTDYGTLEDTVIAAVTNGNASWIGGAIIDGKTYKLSRDSKYQSTINNCKGKKVVFTVKDDEIIWIKPAEDIKTSISCSVNPVSVMYSGKKYSSDTADVIVKISNTLCESDFVGDPEVLANIPELELIIPNAELKIDSNNIFSFNGKQIYSTPVKTLGLGESETFCVTANVKNKKPENAAESKVGINCTFNVTQGNRSFSKVAYGAFKIINNGYKEPTQENVNNSGDKEYRDKLAKAAQELEKATTAFTLEADISNSLKQIFTQEQLDLIARMILCEAAMNGAPEETFQEELERKVIEKVFSINTRWIRLFNDKIVVTVAMKTQKYGVVQVEFTYNRQQSLLNNKPYAFYGNVEYKIIKSDKKLPDSVNLSGPTGAIYMADMSAFCKAAYSVAESELKRSYNKVWGDGANEAADIIFGKSVNNILSKTKYGSVSGLAWAIMTAPAKEVKIKCPVDIYVYDKDNKLVAAVEDNKVTLSNPNVDISVDGDTKTVMLYDDTYRIEYKSAAESTMDVVISEFAGNDQLLETTTFEKVPLKIGVNYTQNIDNTYMDDSEYSLTSNGEEKILPTETKLELHAHTSSSEWKVGREATCAEYGWNYNYCDECNEWYEVITTVDHTFGSWQIVTEPTVDSEGLEKRVCSKCGAEETRAISKLEPVQVTDVELDITQKALNVGDTFTLTATIKPNDATDKSVTWSSSDTSVATVDENGVVTAVSEGTATITATAANGVEASCTVTVKQKGDSVFKKVLNVVTAPFRAIINLFKKLFGK